MKDSVEKMRLYNPLGLWKTVNRMTWPFILLVISLCPSCTSKEDAGNFKEQAIEIADYGLFDLGVADMNNDDRLDIFTANHSGRQSFMLNNGSGAFTDVFAAWKMDQDLQFPGLVVSPKEPPADQPGLYINWVGPSLLVRTHQIDQGTPISGRIEVLSAVEVTDKQDFKVEVTAKELPAKVIKSIIEFSGQEEGYFIFTPLIHALPIQFHFDADLAAENIHVGPNRISPVSGNFAIQMRDRHGMAWADFNNDNRKDLFITRGGLRGTMGNVPLSFWDELFLGTPNGMEDMGKTLGLAKNGCPGRQAAWIDYNADNRLDLYVVSGKGGGSYPNKLFQQTSDGYFKDVAEQVGLDIRSNGYFLWLDADLDGDMDLFWSGIQGFYLYKNESGTFSPNYLGVSGRRTFKLSMADYDNDGDLDIFSASRGGNVLFINTNGTLSAVIPLSLGLPEKSHTANWVDFNNDGFLDLHSVPDGLYMQGQKGDFISSSHSQLNISSNRFSPFQLTGALAAWFDVDNNGTRDLLLATKWVTKKSKWADWFVSKTGSDKRFGGLGYYWEPVLFKNKMSDNHWLQVRLTGPPGNREAIGALVTLHTVRGKQLQQVGSADGSHYSQGHYRVYFGLGQQPEPLSLRVDWPDGTSTVIAAPKVDSLLKISWKER